MKVLFFWVEIQILDSRAKEIFTGKLQDSRLYFYRICKNFSLIWRIKRYSLNTTKKKYFFRNNSFVKDVTSNRLEAILA